MDLLKPIPFNRPSMEGHEQIQAKRKKIWYYYMDNLGDWGRVNAVQLPVIPEYCEQTYHMFYMLLPRFGIKQKLINHLKSMGIQSVFHYQPLNLSSMVRAFGGKEDDCPVTEDISDRLTRLPFYKPLNEDDQARVIEGILSFES